MGNCYAESQTKQEDLDLDFKEQVQFDFNEEKEEILRKNQELTNYLKSGVEIIKLDKDKNYKGEIFEGKANGKGVFVVDDKYEYNGDWINGKPNGFGI